jgi:two-component system, LytTR family, sensor kinase
MTTPSSLYLLDKMLPGVNRKFIPYIIILVIVLISAAIRLVFADHIPIKIQILMTFVQYGFIYSLWTFCSWFNRFLNKVWPYNSKMLLRLVSQIFVTFVFYAILRTGVFLLFQEYIIVKLPKTVMMATYIIDFFIAVSINIGLFAYYLLEQWKESWVRAEQLARENTQVQYDNLKNQLNPHFLFNSLTSLQSLIYKDQELATRFLQQLSKVYRYLLENRLKETVSLKREFDFVAYYVELLKTRFGKSLEINIVIQEEHYDKQIVPVSLQIMIENAIKHNQLTDEQPLKIKIYVENNCLVVSNNLHLKQQVETSNGQGLQNFSQLYAFLSPEPVRWMKGVKEFSIYIPLLNHA